LEPNTADHNITKSRNPFEKMMAEISEANFDSDQASTSKPNPNNNSNGSTVRKSKSKKISSKLTVAENQEGDFKATPSESSKPSVFLPYENVSNCSPFFEIALKPLLPILKPISRRAHAIRWQLSRPLTTRLLPRWFPVGFFDVSFLTYGQVLLALPLLGLFLASYYQTFVAPDAIGSGTIAGLALVMVFLTANKSNSIFTFFLGISFERLQIYHNLSALVAVTLALFHLYVNYIDEGESQFELNGADPNLPKFMFDGTRNISGSGLLLSMIVLVLSSFFPIFRRKFFDLWFWIHILSAISVVIFALMHGIGTAVIFIAWWVLDVVMRYMIMASCRYPKMAQLDLVTSDVVKISFIKPSNFSYNAGQFVQVAFPDLSLYAFHPFSISSSPHEKVVTLHVRGLGNWTKKLVALAETKDSARILIEGPYGCVSLDIDNHDRYQMALCVGGGIGVTHCQSMAKSILNEHNRGRKLKRLRFVWAVRDLEMLKVMEPLETSSDLLDIVLADSESGSEINKLVKTDIFLTKASQDSPTTLEDGRQVHDGRPDLNAIIQDMKEEAKILGVTHVAVFGCGPAKLLYQLKVACRENSSTLTESKGVHFHLHEEVFEF
jgi:predicted ferric reductase